MLLPIAKIFSLCLRLFTRPTINLAKTALKKKEDHSPMVQGFLVATGHMYHETYMRLQRTFLPATNRPPIKQLSEEKALEAGVEFLSEAFVYSILFAWGLYEVRKLIIDTQRKEARQAALLRSLQAEAATLEDQQTLLEARLLSLRLQLLTR